MAGLREPTFAEREGAKHLPTQLQLREVSPEVRAKIWAILYASLENSKYYDRGVSSSRLRGWEDILRSAWVQLDHKFADEFSTHPTKAIPYAKSKMSADYAAFLEFLEFIAKHRNCPSSLPDLFNGIFEESGFAYRISEGTIVPIANEQMAESVISAISQLGNGYEGAQSHLKAAASNLSKGKYADSVRESIHAVESVARKVSPEANTLGPALTNFEEQYHLHPALKKAFLVLYGYTSDEEGVRHALIEEGAPKVTEAEALYMLGSCASFAALLGNVTNEQTQEAASS
jgi:hypothetical protein